jgi:2-hydroxy-3-oxopropionate reductase
MTLKIGFIGLGIMGRPMALHLLKAGHQMRVWARRAESMAPLIDAGAEEAASPADCARGCDVVFTMVSDTPDVEQVVVGPGGVIEGVQPGAVVVDMSTVSPVATRAIAVKLGQKGVEMVDAPVSGGDQGAINATLSIMVGGKPEVFERVKPLFERLGKNIVRIGDNGAGQVAKACNQIVGAVALEAVSEALTLARKNGADPVKVREALLGGYGWSRVLEWHGGRMLARDFKPGFKARLHAKDLNIAVQTAYHYGLSLQQTALIAGHLSALKGRGLGESDSAAVVKVIEGLSGLADMDRMPAIASPSVTAQDEGAKHADPMDIGFIGLGAMGRPMALNLMKAGHRLHVWSRRAETARPLVDAGATRNGSPAEVAQRSDVIFTMVTTGQDVEQVTLGEFGIIQGANSGAVVIDCGTIPPQTTRGIAAALRMAGVELLDAPVSGGEAGAAAATLSIMVGGNREVFERMRPVLSGVGKTLVYMGESGAGQVAKACNQLTLVVALQGIAEAMIFARANGVDFRPVRDALMSGLAASKMLEVFGQRMLDRQFVAGLDAGLHHKDVHIVLQCAQESKTAVPAGALAAEMFNALMAQPGAKWDSAAMLKVVEEASGFPGRGA